MLLRLSYHIIEKPQRGWTVESLYNGVESLRKFWYPHNRLPSCYNKNLFNRIGNVKRFLNKSLGIPLSFKGIFVYWPCCEFICKIEFMSESHPHVVTQFILQTLLTHPGLLSKMFIYVYVLNQSIVNVKT